LKRVLHCIAVVLNHICRVIFCTAADSYISVGKTTKETKLRSTSNQKEEEEEEEEGAR
jgi:hypothetical protein